MYLIDFTSFDPIYIVRIGALVFIYAALYALLRLLKCQHTQAAPVDESIDNDSDVSQTSSQQEIYIQHAPKEMFDSIVRSYATLTCIVPSDSELEENANGVIISDDPNGGVILFNLQECYTSYEDLQDNDFVENRKYPQYDTRYYYLVYARLFITRTREPNSDSDIETSDCDSSKSQDSSESSKESPTTAFYYAKVDSNDNNRSKLKCGAELSLSATSLPDFREKEI
ncbi:hypothetical protein D5b_00194 [Faustovirus]|nr:hypothetical protein D5b_00194 [Faustovirus]AMP44148.1 hypothetical protein PRJ_Dakar_00192 [Faustovirus]